MILGGVGLGICSACRAPGAFWYPIDAPDLPWPGTWLCDSCQHPDAAATRVQADIAARRARITTPTATRHGYQCATPTCVDDTGHPDHHIDQFGREWRTYGDSPTCPHGLNGNVYCVRCDRCLCEQCRAPVTTRVLVDAGLITDVPPCSCGPSWLRIQERLTS